MYIEEDTMDYYVVGLSDQGEHDRLADLPTRNKATAQKWMDELATGKFPLGFVETSRRTYGFGREVAITLTGPEGHDMTIWCPKAFGIAV